MGSLDVPTLRALYDLLSSASSVQGSGFSGYMILAWLYNDTALRIMVRLCNELLSFATSFGILALQATMMLALWDLLYN